jgi:hypothetical protein
MEFLFNEELEEEENGIAPVKDWFAAVKVPISPDGKILASPVTAQSIEELDYNTFHSSFRAKCPVIIRKCCSDWTLAKISSCEAFHEVLCRDGNEDAVRVLVAADNSNFLRHELCDETQVSLKDLVRSQFSPPEPDTYASTTKMYCRLYSDVYPSIGSTCNFDYLASLAFPAVSSASCGYETGSNFKPSNIGLWMSSAKCITPLHFDICHGLLNQINGKKRFVLASPEDTPYLYWKYAVPKEAVANWILDGNTTKNGTSSSVNLQKYLDDPVTRSCCPLLENVTWWVADLEPGGKPQFTYFGRTINSLHDFAVM